MNWEVIGATGEWAGSIVVVATLFYLARQVRQNTRASRAGASYSINDSLSKIVGAIRADGEFADIWIRGCEDIDALNPVERVRFPSHLLDMLNLAEYVNQLEKQDLSDAHIDYIPWIALLYRENPGIRSFMDALKPGYAGSKELFDRLTDTDSAFGTNVYGR